VTSIRTLIALERHTFVSTAEPSATIETAEIKRGNSNRAIWMGTDASLTIAYRPYGLCCAFRFGRIKESRGFFLHFLKSVITVASRS
jgi:hypothetical protein